MNRDDIIWSKIQVAISRSTSLTDLEKVALGCQIRAAIVDGIEAWEDDRRDAVIKDTLEAAIINATDIESLTNYGKKKLVTLVRGAYERGARTMVARDTKENHQ